MFLGGYVLQSSTAIDNAARRRGESGGWVEGRKGIENVASISICIFVRHGEYGPVLRSRPWGGCRGVTPQPLGIRGRET